MKHKIIVVFLIFISCKNKQDLENYTYVTPKVLINFHDSIVKPKVYNYVKIYTIMENGIEMNVSVAESDTEIDINAIEEINGLDANLYKYIEVNKGQNIESSKTKINGQKVIKFSYETYIPNLSRDTYSNGFLLYHENYMILAEFVNNKSTENKVFEQRNSFLKSLSVK